MGKNVSLRLVFSTDQETPSNSRIQIRVQNPATGECRELQHDPSVPLLIEDLVAEAGRDFKLEIGSRWFKSESRWCTLLHDILNNIEIVLHGCDPDDEHHPCRPPKIADRMDETSLAEHLVTRLAGTPADGSAGLSQAPDKVIWVDGGDEVLVHLDSVRTAILDGMILVSMDLETDQTGRTSMVVPFAVSRPNDPAGLVAVTEEFPSGNGVLASRWGTALQAAAWSSLLSLAGEHADERGSAPLGISAVKGTVALTAGAALNVGGAHERR
jgi:hypothetical protein